jgi:excinuclease ABC subunit A
MSRRDRDWILYTDEQPQVPVYPGYTHEEVKRAVRKREEPSYMGTFTSARKYALETFATTQSASNRKRVAQYLVSTECPRCHGKRL